MRMMSISRLCDGAEGVCLRRFLLISDPAFAVQLCRDETSDGKELSLFIEREGLLSIEVDGEGGYA